MRMGILGILSLALVLGGCADEWAEMNEGCHPEGDCEFSKADWEKIQTLAMTEPPPTYEFGLAESVGEAIFFDEGLGPHGVSCASCHPAEGWFTVPITRREPGSDEFRGITSIIDSTYYDFHKWDGSKETIVDLMKGAIEKPSLVDGNRVAVALHVYDTLYGQWFAMLRARAPLLDDLPVATGKPDTSEWAALSDEMRGEVDDVYTTVGSALEAYMRTIVSTPSPFDAYAAGDFEALDDAQKRGLALFIGKGHCVECHSGPRFTDDDFHNIGLAIEPEKDDRSVAVCKLEDPTNKQCADLEPGDPALDPALVGAFRTPTLRNVAMTPPYMHTSEYETLEQVVWHYTDTIAARFGHLDGRMWETDLTDDEVWDLVAFLETLTSTSCPWMPGEVCPPAP